MVVGSAAMPLRLAEVLAASVPHRLGGAGLRLSALERSLRQDPTDLGRRAAAVALYSREASSVLEGGTFHGSEAERRKLLEEPLGRAQEHLEYILEATDDARHLHEVLGRSLGARLFYQLPEITARFMRKMALDRECLKEFGARSEFEERATPYHLANALAVLKAAGRTEAARELFEEAVQLQWNGRRPICWQRLEQTPAVYIEGLDHRPLWEGEHRPALAALLEEHWMEIREDLQTLREARRAGGLLQGLLPTPRASASNGGRGPPEQVPAYPNLVEEADGGGVWDMLQLYVSRRWQQEACQLLPRTARLLRKHLPSADVPYVHYNTEEVVLFLLAPGSKVRLHNGGSNAPLNLHLGLSGCDGAHLEVAGEPRALREGKVVCFDDGTDHRVWHTGSEERWVMTVRMMHPQLASRPAEYFSRAFTRRTCFEAWDEKRQARLVGGGRASS